MKHLFPSVLLLALLWAGCETAPDRADGEYADTMAAMHEGDTPVASGLVQEPMLPVETASEAYGNAGGQALTGYLAVPTNPDSVAQAMGATGGALPGLIVIHEWWGLNENIEAMTRRLAGQGYRALAVDLYNGAVAMTPDQARGLMQGAMENQEAMRENLVAAYNHLTQQHGAPTVGVIGWCFGGAQSLSASLALPTELDAAVIYYGRVEGVGEEQLSPLQVPILGFFGGQDDGIPVEGVRTFEETLTTLGKDVEVHIYDEAGHAFANPSGQNFVEDAAFDAWDKTLAFLNEHLY